jgi:pimeloyl-ACP methyl ester carboxylesterase
MRNLSSISYRVLMLGVAFFGLIVAGSVARASVDPAALCQEKKAKAAGKKAFDHLKAYGKDAKKPNVEKLTADISKSESKFAKAFGSAETKGGCDTTGDAAAIEAKVDDFVRDILCGGPVNQETVTIPSAAQPAETPGTPGVNASAYPKLVTMFGGTDFSLNNATYTRYYCGDGAQQPDAILILVPGFEGGAANFKILAENTVLRALEHSMSLEVWAFDRRGHQMEDLVGQDIAEAENDALILLDWFYGAELGFSLHPALVAGPNRRAEFHNEHEDTAFMANWTYLVFSQDIDAVVEAARSAAANQNVFLGGHSAGTGFTARYASTDFDLSGAGPAEPGYAKLRGLVLLDGGGGSTAVAPLTDDQLDRIEDKADGGLFYAVRDNEKKCVDGTACADDSDCVGHGGHETCTEPTAAYAIVPGILYPRVMAAGEVTSIQGKTDPDTGESLIGVDFGDPRCVGGSNAGSTCADDTDCPGGSCEVNDAIRQVPELNGLALLGKTTAAGGLGGFMDDDGLISSLATFVQTSLGAPGPIVNGLRTWLDITEGPMPPSVLPNNGPPPTSLPGTKWGQEKEVTRMDRLMVAYYTGKTNFTDYYYPSGGNSTTSGIGLDSTQLSVGRGRRDIENLTQAANVNIPVICFGGSNGAVPVPGGYVPFAQSLGTCTAPSCSGAPRVVDAALPNPAFPTLGDVAGGFEVYISEGYAHLDMLTAEDGEHNNVVGPLVDFLMRNVH